MEFTNKLLTLELMHTFKSNQNLNPTCRRCKQTLETTPHIFTCPEALNSQRRISIKFKALLVQRISNTELGTTLLAKGYTKDTTIATISDFFQPHSETFMATPIASGFVTNLFKTQLLAQFPNISSKTHKQLITSIFDCWLTVLYTKIWCMRNKATYLPSKDVRFDGRDMHIHHRQANVRPLPAIPRYDAPTTDSEDDTDPTQPRLTIAEALENQQRLYELATAAQICTRQRPQRREQLTHSFTA
jgi:hypothetical protein